MSFQITAGTVFLFSAMHNEAPLWAEPLQKPVSTVVAGCLSFDGMGLEISLLQGHRVYCPPHLLVRQELKPGEVLLGGITAFLHTNSLLYPVQGEDIRHSKKKTQTQEQSFSQTHSPVILLQLLKYLLDN